MTLFLEVAEDEEPMIAKWLPFIGTEESETNYSSVLINNQTFLDYAKASNHVNGSKKLSEKVISGNDDKNCDKLCQLINKKFMKLIVESGTQRKSQKTDQGKVGILLHMNENNGNGTRPIYRWNH